LFTAASLPRFARNDGTTERRDDGRTHGAFGASTKSTKLTKPTKKIWVSLRRTIPRWRRRASPAGTAGVAASGKSRRYFWLVAFVSFVLFVALVMRAEGAVKGR
jgi:hypothetical protein